MKYFFFGTLQTYILSSAVLIYDFVWSTVNPLYNNIRYNSKIRYNVNLVKKEFTSIGSSSYLLEMTLIKKISFPRSRPYKCKQ